MTSANTSDTLVADDTLGADRAYRHITQGGTVLWQGDFHNGRQLLQALARRIDRPKGSKQKAVDPPREPDNAHDKRQAFHRHRQQQAQRAALLNRVLVLVQPDGQVALRRAPDTRAALAAAQTENELDTAGTQPGQIALRAVLGMLGALEWQRKGVMVNGLERPVHVSWGVFSPLRGEYLDLIWQAQLPAKATTACDVGTGSGVLAIILAKRGVQHIIATDINPKALQCAQHNVDQHGFGKQITVLHADLFAPGQFDLVICNPPWLPVRPTSAIEQALYDPDHAMLKSFLAGAAGHLNPGGQVWLIMSDLAEHLGLREPGYLEDLFDNAGLRIVTQHSTRPRHAKADATGDPLHFARRLETTTLWCLEAKTTPSVANNPIH
jgi:methylase of polypeptide subunit release factors